MLARGATYGQGVQAAHDPLRNKPHLISVPDADDDEARLLPK